MKTLFDIQSGRNADRYTLLLEVGSEHCCYAFFDKAAQAIDRINYSVFDETDIDTHLGKLIDELKEKQFESVAVASAFPQALLVPRKLFREDYSMLDVVYDQPTQKFLHDTVPEWQLVVMYSLPQSSYQLIETAFKPAKYFHVYTPCMKVYNGFVAENQLSVHFSPERFRVVVKKEHHVQLVQTYSYKTPLDVVYYLLKICYEFGLQQSEIHLILSGLLEKDSALYTQLQGYFFNIHFAHPPVLRLPKDEHPQYFFSSLYNLAACAL